jgi:hypothetical protein
MVKDKIRKGKSNHGIKTIDSYNCLRSCIVTIESVQEDITQRIKIQKNVTSYRKAFSVYEECVSEGKSAYLNVTAYRYRCMGETFGCG